MTTFYRLLKDTNKASALRSAVTARRSGDTDAERTFTVDPAAFSKVPNTPFAYWVDDEIRDLFVKLPPFESEGRTVKQGLATADDFRFVRAWWEVDPARRLDPGLGGAPDWREDLETFQAWCRRRTHEGKGWAPFAKGGEYSPYYSDIHLVVNWEREGEEMKAFAGSVIRNPDYYFRPGVTFSARVRRFSMSSVPSGCLFSHVGMMAFSEDHEDLPGIVGATSSLGMRFVLSMLTLTRKYEVGYVKSAILPASTKSSFSGAKALIESRRAELQSSELTLNYGIGRSHDPIDLPDFDGPSLHAFGLSSLDESFVRRIVSEFEQLVSHDDEDTMDDEIGATHSPVSRHFDLAFARWDLRLALNPELVPALPDPFDPLPVVPPATLVSPDGLPATTGKIVSEEWLQAQPNAITLPPTGTVTTPTITDDEYPIPIPWDGILVDDPDHPADIVARIRQVLAVLHGEGAQRAEEEFCAELAVDTLREYIANPKGFFADHLSRYSKSRRKAPIYWPLSTPSGGWTAWIYYPRLTDATIYTLIDRYLRPRREVVQQLYEEIDRIPAASRTRSQQRQCDEAARDGEELAAMEEDLKQIAAMPYRPNHDDGVPILASPFHRYFRHREWAKYLTGIRQSLEAGEYDWAHLAYAVWPERVREKARTDRSIAIAHGIEEET